MDMFRGYFSIGKNLLNIDSALFAKAVQMVDASLARRLFVRIILATHILHI